MIFGGGVLFNFFIYLHLIGHQRPGLVLHLKKSLSTVVHSARCISCGTAWKFAILVPIHLRGIGLKKLRKRVRGSQISKQCLNSKKPTGRSALCLEDGETVTLKTRPDRSQPPTVILAGHRATRLLKAAFEEQGRRFSQSSTARKGRKNHPPTLRLQNERRSCS